MFKPPEIEVLPGGRKVRVGREPDPEPEIVIQQPKVKVTRKAEPKSEDSEGDSE